MPIALNSAWCSWEISTYLLNDERSWTTSESTGLLKLSGRTLPHLGLTPTLSLSPVAVRQVRKGPRCGGQAPELCVKENKLKIEKGNWTTRCLVLLESRYGEDKHWDSSRQTALGSEQAELLSHVQWGCGMKSVPCSGQEPVFPKEEGWLWRFCPKVHGAAGSLSRGTLLWTHQRSPGSIFSKETSGSWHHGTSQARRPGQTTLSTQMLRESGQSRDLIDLGTIMSKCHSHSKSSQWLWKEKALSWTDK